jgi:hypothetical protein
MEVLVNLTATVNDTLSPTIAQVDLALVNIDSANTSLRNSNVQQYVDQVDQGVVRNGTVTVMQCSVVCSRHMARPCAPAVCWALEVGTGGTCSACATQTTVDYIAGSTREHATPPLPARPGLH